MAINYIMRDEWDQIALVTYREDYYKEISTHGKGLGLPETKSADGNPAATIYLTAGVEGKIKICQRSKDKSPKQNCLYKTNRERVGVSKIYPSADEPLENTGFDGMPDGNTARFDSKMIATIKT